MTMQTRSNPFVSTATLISAMCAAQASRKRASLVLAAVRWTPT